MDRIKNFIKKKKLDKKFKQAGQGNVLQDEDGMISQPGFPCRIPAPQSPTQSDPALQKPIAVPTRPDVSAIAQAAEKRMAKAKPANQDLTPMQKLVKMQAQRELEREQRKLAEQMGHIRTQDDQGPSQQQQRQMHQPKVLYTCELFDEEVALPKSEMLSAVEECLFEQLKDGEADPISTVVYIIYTLNKEDVRNPAVETILKYLQNIINNPEEVKFRRIRLSNKVFKEKVAPCKGAIDFLKIVGFHEEKQSVDGNGNNGEMEMFLVLPQPNMGSLAQMQNALTNGKAIAIRVYRDRKVFYIDPFAQLTNPEIPEDFFMRTADETEALEKMSVLRTQKMREMDAAREKLNSTFKYTYIRIRFPDNFMLQGIFNVFEKLTAVREFVHKNLEIGHGSFSLTAPQLNKQQQSDMDEKTLVQLGLVPTSLLYFEWDGETKRQFEHEGTQIAYLKRELIESAENMN